MLQCHKYNTMHKIHGGTILIIVYILAIILIVMILYLLSIKPTVLRDYDLKHWKGKCFAHRGLHKDKNEIPENSMAAFQLALENKYGIEIDVQLSKDNVPVVFHDFTLKRVCGVNKKVNELTSKELHELYLHDSKEKIPTLQAVLDLVQGKVPLLIEFKAEGTDISVCQACASLLDNYKGIYCIQSFNPLVLLWYKNNKPHIMRGQLASNFIKDKETGSKTLYFILQNLLLNFITKPNFISYNFLHRHTPSLFLCRKLYHAPTFAWTIRTKQQLDDCKQVFDYYIFENFIPNDATQ